MVVLPLALTADVSTGKFCRLFGPVSASHGSLGVTPAGARSIPSAPFEKIELALTLLAVPDCRKTPAPALEKIELPRMTLPTPTEDLDGFGFTRTPAPPLKAITLRGRGSTGPVAGEPTVTLVASWPRRIPLP